MKGVPGGVNPPPPPVAPILGSRCYGLKHGACVLKTYLCDVGVVFSDLGAWMLAACEGDCEGGAGGVNPPSPPIAPILGS